jgi:hypothetical protein
MRMTRCVYIGSRLVDRGVDRKSRGVDWLVAFDDVAGFMDEDEV